MNRDTSPGIRQALLRALLLPLITVALYVYVVKIPLDARQREAAARANAATSAGASSSGSSRNSSDTTLAALERQVASLRKQAGQVERRITRLAHGEPEGGWPGTRPYAESVGWLSDVLRRNGLLILKEGPDTGGAALLPPLIRELIRERRQAATPAATTATRGHVRAEQVPVRAWRVTMRGGYLDTLRAIDQLVAGPTPAVLLSLDLTAPIDSGWPEWTLVVWI
ncbi:MAG: hypothetical protein AB7K09_12240 [Planctomycetota bacterium]